jgi:putative spermidine/putrescine transport system permease protein
LRWFETIFGSQEWIAAALTSLRIGAATCVATLVIATLTVLGFGRHFRYQGAADALLLSPLTVPSVVFALGAYLAFARVALVDTETGIIIAHTVLIFPIVYLVASATFSSIDPWLSLAAASLGANPWRIFRTIVFPLLLPGLGVGTLLAMLLSFDESVASIFLSNLSVKTLPRKLWEGIHFNTSPESAAVSVVLLGVTCAMVVVGMMVVLGRRKNALLPVQARPEPVLVCSEVGRSPVVITERTAHLETIAKRLERFAKACGRIARVGKARSSAAIRPRGSQQFPTQRYA